jgi:hypothetical protein
MSFLDGDDWAAVDLLFFLPPPDDDDEDDVVVGLSLSDLRRCISSHIFSIDSFFDLIWWWAIPVSICC